MTTRLRKCLVKSFVNFSTTLRREYCKARDAAINQSEEREMSMSTVGGFSKNKKTLKMLGDTA